ncbi:MAG: signal peptide peptidase SppA, partial [Robiginitomaculum sp.]
MKQFLITVAGVMVGLFLIIIIPVFLLIMAGISASMSHSAQNKSSQSDAQVLRIDLRVPMSDQEQASIFDESPSLVSLVETLMAAREDENVKGLF